MKITFVKKIKSDGLPCKKCLEVEQRLRDADQMDRIDQVVIADERDLQSDGMQLAAKHQVDRAPFFIVENEDGNEMIYTIYFQFVKEVLNGQVN